MQEATLCFLASATHVRLAQMLSGPFAGNLNGYGGKVEDTDQDVVSATLRELGEEAGITARAKDLYKVAVIDCHNYKDREPYKMRVYVSVLRSWIGIPAASKEMGPPELYTPEGLPLRRMMLGDRIWLPLILQGARVYGEIYYSPGFTGLEKQPIINHITIKDLDRLWARS